MFSDCYGLNLECSPMAHILMTWSLAHSATGSGGTFDRWCLVEITGDMLLKGSRDSCLFLSPFRSHSYEANSFMPVIMMYCLTTSPKQQV
jgi:hypothetical protein